MLCLRLLLKESPDWTFYLNPAGSELPVKGIEDIRERLREGQLSLVASHKIKPNNLSRFRQVRGFKRYNLNHNS